MDRDVSATSFHKVKRMDHENDYQPPNSVENMNAWSFTAILTHVYGVLHKYKNSFTFNCYNAV
jgi:hypothetical protein